MLALSHPYLLDHLGRDGGLTNSGLSPAHDPVYGCGLLVSAIVAADRQNLHVRVLLLECVQGLLCPLRNTAHKGSVNVTGDTRTQRSYKDTATHTLESMFMPIASPV